MAAEALRCTNHCLGRNRNRFNYPEHQRQGITVASGCLDKLEKVINGRVNVAEMI